MNKGENTLVILSPGFAASEADSTCLPMQQHFIQCINAMHPELTLIVLAFQYPYVAKKYSWHGVTVISFNGKNKGGLSKLLLRKKIYTALKEIHHKKTIIGLLSFWYTECALVGKRFGAQYGIRQYCWILGQDARKTNKYPQRLAPKPGELIALSDFLQDEFERSHGVKPFLVIPPGIGPTEAAGKKDVDILAAGSLIPLKRYDIFISVLAEIKKKRPMFKALLIGEGPEKMELKKRIEEFNLETHVALAGELPYEEVLGYMQRTKVFLHPSSYEGFSGVCMEALSKGAHVISFCQPMKQSIQQWHIVKSADEMSEKALDILQNPATLYRPVVPYSMNETVRRMMKLFEEDSFV